MTGRMSSSTRLGLREWLILSPQEIQGLLRATFATSRFTAADPLGEFSSGSVIEEGFNDPYGLLELRDYGHSERTDARFVSGGSDVWNGPAVEFSTPFFDLRGSRAARASSFAPPLPPSPPSPAAPFAPPPRLRAHAEEDRRLGDDSPASSSLNSERPHPFARAQVPFFRDPFEFGVGSDLGQDRAANSSSVDPLNALSPRPAEQSAPGSLAGDADATFDILALSDLSDACRVSNHVPRRSVAGNRRRPAVFDPTDFDIEFEEPRCNSFEALLKAAEEGFPRLTGSSDSGRERCSLSRPRHSFTYGRLTPLGGSGGGGGSGGASGSGGQRGSLFGSARPARMSFNNLLASLHGSEESKLGSLYGSEESKFGGSSGSDDPQEIPKALGC